MHAHPADTYYLGWPALVLALAAVALLLAHATGLAGQAARRLSGWQRSTVAGVGALLYALLAALSISRSVLALRCVPMTAWGVLDAFRFSRPGLLHGDSVPLATCILVNRMLAAWARHGGAGSRALQRAQSIAILGVLVLEAAAWIGMNRAEGAWIVVFSLRGLVWIGNLLLTSALLGAYAVRTARTSGTLGTLEPD